MEYVAFFVGILIAYFYISKSTEWMAILYYLIPFRSRESFENLYDMADDTVTYEFFKESVTDFDSYASYLRIHEAARGKAYGRFKKYYDALFKLVLLRILPITLLPAILFWSNWYFYLCGVAVVAFIYLVNGLVVKRRGPGFYQRFIVSAVINEHLAKTKLPTKAR